MERAVRQVTHPRLLASISRVSNSCRPSRKQEMSRDLARCLVAILSGVMLTSAAGTARAKDPVVFVSAFAPGDRGGIHAYEIELKTGTLKPLHRTADVKNPFFLALSPDRRFLYSIHAEKFGGKEPEQVAAYQVEGRTGRLKLL